MQLSAFEIASRLAAELGGGIGTTGGQYMVRCPCHADGTASLAIRDGQLAPILFCHGGCDTRDVIDALRDRGLWPGRDRSGSARIVPIRKPARERNDAEAVARYLFTHAKGILRESHPIAGTLAERYLHGRSLDVADLPGCLRFQVSLWHSGTRENWPAMVAPLCDIRTDEIVGVHRTYLSRDGRGKAPIEPQRMVLGKLGGSVIKLTPDENVEEGLHIGEGIETALACMQRDFRPMWACVTAGGIRDFPVLSGIECLTIAADHDHAGLSAAQVCGERWAAAGKEVFIRWPEGLGRDFADGGAA